MTQSTLPPQQPVGHSGLYPKQNTHWSVNDGQIMVSKVDDGTVATAEPFVFKGVRYQPTPIGMAGTQAGSPMGDLFYIGMQGNGDDAKTMMFYEPIWQRDVGPSGLIRKMGANNVGVYTTYNVPPFTMSDSDGQGTVVATAAEDPPVDWTALGPIRYVDEEYPTYMPQGASAKTSPPYWYHMNHDRFLDICWNGGTDPIYVFLGIGISTQAFFSSNGAPANGSKYTQVQEYFEKSATWLAQSYGSHPALAGFYLTNETNQPGPSGTSQYYEYWTYLNSISKKIKQQAPHKLTIASMQDDIATLTTQLCQYETAPVPGQPAPATQELYVTGSGIITTSPNGGVEPTSDLGAGAPNRPALATDVYELDIWGWNLYAQASDETPIIKHAKAMKANGTPMAPIVLTEIGIPQAMRYVLMTEGVTEFGPLGGNDPYVGTPNGYQATWADNKLTVGDYITNTSLGRESAPVITKTHAERVSGDFFVNNPTLNAGGLVVYESDTKEYYLFVGKPLDPGQVDPDGGASEQDISWVHLDKTAYGTLLDELRSSGNGAAGPAVALHAYLDAAKAFQVGRESVTNADQVLNGVQVFEFCDEWDKWADAGMSATKLATCAGVHDFADKAIAPWGPANAQFYTTWEEEWFGLCSALPNGRSSTSSPISTDGWLAGGGADDLTPRASYTVVKNFFADS